MKQKDTDTRVNKHQSPLLDFLYTFSILSVLSASQEMILFSFMEIETYVPSGFIWGMIGYWGIVSFLFVWITTSRKKRSLYDPLKKLRQAVREAALGDFSIRLQPLHPPHKFDEIDVMYEDYNKMVEELGSTDNLKHDFISDVSHELKSPLAVIQSYAMALQKSNISNEEREDYTKTIISATQKLSSLVSNILKLNRLENQEILPAVAPFDISKQLCDCALLFEDKWEMKNLIFKAELEEKVLLLGDESMLEIIWVNLLSNAIKFSEPGGTVILKQISDRENIFITVSDTGCGMTKETAEHIFDKFYQGETSHSKEGNGLGLALLKRVLEITGGKISVSSTPGEGSSFTVILKRTGTDN